MNNITYKKKYLDEKEFHILEFQKYKQFVLKKYPNSKVIKFHDEYYIVDVQGFKIIPTETYINNSDTVFNAWKSTALYLEIASIIERNTYKFNDDKSYESYNKSYTNDKVEVEIEDKNVDEFNHEDKFD
jgi:hypothetical protein